MLWENSIIRHFSVGPWRHDSVMICVCVKVPLGGGGTRNTWRTFVLWSCRSHGLQASLPKSQSICLQTFGSKAAVAGWGQRLLSVYIYKTTASPRWPGSSETAKCWYAFQVTEHSEPHCILQHLLSLVKSIWLLEFHHVLKFQEIQLSS